MRTIILAILAAACWWSKSNVQINTETPQLSTSQRTNLVFILGDDESESNPYYDLARRFYLKDPNVILVDSCRTILDFRNHLEKIHVGNVPFGNIEIVVHSNPWTGVSAPILEEQQRANTDQLLQAIVSKQFVPLNNEIIDSNTVINLQSCGLGNNEAFLEAFKHAIGGFDEQQPIVNASKDFVQYRENEHHQIEQKSLKSWFAFYKTGYRPGHIKLSRQLKKRYPESEMDWIKALQNTKANADGEAYHYTFNVPLEWKVAFNGPSEMPECKNNEEILEFLKEQEDLVEAVEKMEIPIEKFRWKIRKVIDVEKPYIKVLGKTTILCVLKEDNNIIFN